MRNTIPLALSLVVLISGLPSARAAPAIPALSADGDDADAAPPFPPPFFRRGPYGSGPEIAPNIPGLRPPVGDGQPAIRRGGEADGSPTAPEPEKAEAPVKPPTRAETIDKLLGRLAKTNDADEAKGIAELVERLWMKSDSDTADLLMTRALAAMNGERRDVASVLLDQIIALRPGWAEAWNKRATLRFLQNDDIGSMEDISHVLALEPRHFGALSGMGFILERHGDDQAALTVLRRALAVYPEDAEIRKAVDKLAPSVEGQAL